ncbi:MAG: MaoC/PaaZ C-terminal domain-containing protein [Candidatus Rokuibacteriota bacterium]
MSPSLATPQLGAGIVGLTAGPAISAIDARWLMAYAAALGEEDPRYYDTTAPVGPLAHPLFAVCYEWPLAVALRERAIGDAAARFGVHATHALTIHRPPRAGDRLSTTARVVAVERQRAGTLVVFRFETVDEAGAPVTTTDHGSVYRGVEADGSVAAASRPAAADAGDVRWQTAVSVALGAAHVYTEGARIWNPIHTDRAVALAAGLPGIILHGTATLALAVSRVVRQDLDGDLARVRGIRARFTGMVALPSTFVVRGRARDAAHIAFDADADGRPVLSDAAIPL